LLVWFDLNAWPQYAQVAGLAQVQDCCFAGDAGVDVDAGVDAGLIDSADDGCNQGGDCHPLSVRIAGLDAFILLATVGRPGAALPYES
jgi:hypothetical protein